MVTNTNREETNSIDKAKESIFKKKYYYVYTATEIMSQKAEQIPFLWGSHIPNQGLVALTGSSDVGKTSLLRHLALSITLKKKTFLGYDLNVRFGRVIYVSTEENKNSINFSLKRQLDKSVDPKDLRQLCYIFNSDHILKMVEEQLKAEQTDAVIIDCFTDVFTGSMNDVISVRRFLNNFDKLASDYDSAIIFLNHNGKRTDQLNAHKDNIVGSQGFEAKMRLIMELRKGPSSDHRYLWFTKGNYLPEKQKNVAMELLFDDKQEFEFTGRFYGKNNEGGISVDAPREYDEKSKSEIIRLATELQGLGLSLDKIRDKLKESIERVPSKGTLSNWLSNLGGDQSTKV